MTDPVSVPPAFATLGLRAEVLRAIADSGYTEPTPIQARAIPEVLARRDVVGIAQTGTGKTASFVLPMLDILAAGRARARMPRSLIISPTRELATQTARNFEIYGKYLNLSMALLIGGVGMGDQEKLLDKGVDVLIATPGRLLDWFERGKVMLGGVEILVIDEADRMFDMGFMPDVEKIVSLLLGRKQTLLFSATMPPEVRRLAERFLKDAAEISVARQAATAALIDDVVIEVERDRKREALVALIRRSEVPKAIVFCNRKRDISGTMRFLQKHGLNARDLHGDLEQVHRQATLDQFTKGTVDFLVATDVAARGLDISDMPVVINFDVPINPEDYVHRVGRTGRAGRSGRAFTFVSREDGKALAAIERLAKRAIPRLDLGGAAAVPPAEIEAPPARERRPQRPEAPALEAGPPRGGRRRLAPAPDRKTGRRTEREPERPVEAAPERVRERPPERVSQRHERPAERLHDRAGERAFERPEGPVLAFGDHVPGFLLRPIPAKLLARSRASAEADPAAD